VLGALGIQGGKEWEVVKVQRVAEGRSLYHTAGRAQNALHQLQFNLSLQSAFFCVCVLGREAGRQEVCVWAEYD
jgi:hypothetical protein